jgi:SHC-transforming protein 1
MEESLLPQHISVNYSSNDTRAMMKDGFKFNVTYLGSVEILISMKVLDYNTRKAVARWIFDKFDQIDIFNKLNYFRECINLIKGTSDRRNSLSKTNSKYISNLICREHADTKVNFEINDKTIELKDTSLNFVLVKHEIAQVSFVCSGDEDSQNYIAYIAKDFTEWRACYVVKCDIESVINIINSMDSTFQTKYKELFKNDTYSSVIPPQPKSSLKSKLILFI